LKIVVEERRKEVSHLHHPFNNFKKKNPTVFRNRVGLNVKHTKTYSFLSPLKNTASQNMTNKMSPIIAVIILWWICIQLIQGLDWILYLMSKNP
jgi:hypothetical protein